METDITPFAYGDHQVRVVTRDGEPWFVARDVCDVLAITNAGNVLAALDEDERSSIHIADGTSGNPNKALVSEKTTPRITTAGQENLIDGWLTGRYTEDD